MEDAAFDARMNTTAPAQTTYQTKVPYAFPGGMFNSANRPDLASSEFNVDSYMEDTMYSPAPTPTRIPGLSDMGMGEDFRFMS
jgi:hypothetical protein